MKTIICLIILSLTFCCDVVIFKNNPTCNEQYKQPPTSKFCVESCALLPVGTDNIGEVSDFTPEYTRCCRIKYKLSGTYNCIPITDEQYHNIDLFIKNFREHYPEKGKIKINCNSKYLVNGILGLIALFLF